MPYERALQSWRIALTGVFLVSLIGGLVIAAKPLLILDISVPGSIILFPFSYSCVIVALEVYGSPTAERFIEVGLFSLLLFAIALEISVQVPPAPGYHLDHAYRAIFGAEYFIILLVAAVYLISQTISFSCYRLMQRGGVMFRLPGFRLFAAPFIAQLATIVLAMPLSSYLRHLAFAVAAHQMGYRLLWAAAQSALAVPLIWWAILLLRHLEESDDLESE